MTTGLGIVNRAAKLAIVGVDWDSDLTAFELCNRNRRNGQHKFGDLVQLSMQFKNNKIQEVKMPKYAEVSWYVKYWSLQKYTYNIYRNRNIYGKCMHESILSWWKKYKKCWKNKLRLGCLWISSTCCDFVRLHYHPTRWPVTNSVVLVCWVWAKLYKYL